MKDYEGRQVESLVVHDAGGYNPSTITITWEDGSKLIIHAGTVNYDQYSSSPCLYLKEEE